MGLTEKEFALSAKTAGLTPYIGQWSGSDTWVMFFIPKSPAGHFSVLVTARGGRRDFYSPCTAVKVCQKWGLACTVLPAGTDAIAKVGGVRQ